MCKGLIGKKLGMTALFTSDGKYIPVTVVQVGPCVVTQIKNMSSDGYSAIQLGFGEKKKSRINKPMQGHFKKSGAGCFEFLREVPVDDSSEYKLGQTLNLDLFTIGERVDVSGTTKGRGFAGVIKRHNFQMQDATHGNSVSHRAPGSIGQNQTPGRVFKGKKMAGHMGNVKSTVQNLEVVRVDVERNLLLVKGAVPGHKGSNVVVTPAMKFKNKKEA